MRVRAGQKIDRYELLEPLGAGGQGSVWRAKDLLEPGTVRAVKLIVRERVSAADFERARREAHTLAQTNHPALLACYGVFDDVRIGIGGIVLDFVDGVPLSDVLHDARLTPAHRHGFLQQLADALAFVHERNIVHRDLKPDNILLPPNFWVAPAQPGTVKLIDFGISVELGNPRPLTATGAIFGTAPYLAPELMAGDLAVGNHGAQSVDGFARDMFAFGVVAAEVLLGKHPTGLPVDAPRERFAQVYREAARGSRVWPPAELTGPWANAVRACLAIPVRARPRNGAELVRLSKGGTIAAPQTELAMTSTPQKGRTTEPMPYAPNSNVYRPNAPNAHPAPPPIPEWSPPPEIPITSYRGMAGMFVAGIAVAGTLFYFLSKKADNEPEQALLTILPTSTGPAPLKQDPIAPAPAPLPAPAPTFDRPTNQTEASVCSSLCCGGSLCQTSSSNVINKNSGCDASKSSCEACPSGRACVPGACTDHLAPAANWQVRLAGVSRDDTSIPAMPSDIQVCLRPSRLSSVPYACVYNVYSGTTKGIFAGAGINTDDIHSTGVDIELRDARGRVFASRAAARFEDKVRITALCKGLVLRDIFGRHNDRYIVRVYLDDP